MKVVEYKKIISETGSVINPPWIVYGDMFFRELDKTYVGLVLNEDERDYYIPDTVTYLTIDDLVDRLAPFHKERPFSIKTDGVRSPVENVSDFVDYWWNKYIT